MRGGGDAGMIAINSLMAEMNAAERHGRSSDLRVFRCSPWTTFNAQRPFELLVDSQQ